MNHKLMIVILLLAAAAPISAGEFSLTVLPPRIHNRHPVLFTEGSRAALRFDEQMGDGLAWWPDIKFSDGTIEFDVRGKDVFQRSFIGVAFHGVDEKTFDAVYFRPFNFRATDPARKNHAVQYIAMPDNDWQLLRSKYPEKYEKPVSPVPAPDGWFHARVFVAYPKVSVFVNEATDPCLTVEKLNERRTGWIGLWVGNGSGGEFANVRVIPSLK